MLIIGAASLWTIIITCLFQGRSCPRWPDSRASVQGTGSRPVDPRPSGPGGYLIPGRVAASPFLQAGPLGRAGGLGSPADAFCCQLCPELAESTFLATLGQALLPASPWLLGQASRSTAAPAAWPGSGSLTSTATPSFLAETAL